MEFIKAAFRLLNANGTRLMPSIFTPFSRLLKRTQLICYSSTFSIRLICRAKKIQMFLYFVFRFNSAKKLRSTYRTYYRLGRFRQWFYMSRFHWLQDEVCCWMMCDASDFFFFRRTMNDSVFIVSANICLVNTILKKKKNTRRRSNNKEREPIILNSISSGPLLNRTFQISQ